MKSPSLPLLLVLAGTLSHALVVPMKQVRPRTTAVQKRSGRVSYGRPKMLAAAGSDDSDINMSTVHDIIYLANLTLGGNDYTVQLDTGSSDLWIKGPSSPLPNSQQTTITYNLTYGIGWAYGHVSYSPVEFAGISISSQAYLDVSDAMNPALSYGALGIVGLGFTSLSTVDALVNHTGTDSGRSLLYNAFKDNPSEPNYIAFALQRSSQPNDDVEGTFSIGEVVPEYADVLKQKPIPTFPESYPSRWNVLLDAVLVGTKTVPVSSTVAGAPSNKAVILLDSGTSYTFAPEDVCNAIYGGVPGAQYDASVGQWIVPCDAEIDMALQINGEVYPIHPLDVTPASLSDPTKCAGTFIPQAVAVGQGEFDWLVGDNVLRSVYSIYDFGDFDSSGKMGNPFVKLLSLTDPNEASKEFHELRGGVALTNITYNAADSKAAGTVASGASADLTADTISTLNSLTKYIPAMLAIMALNAFAILVGLGAGAAYLFRQSRGGARSRPTPGRTDMAPMPMNPTTSFSMPSPGPAHTYEPVSMALTEDTVFVPPSPAFSKDGAKARPMSVA